MKSTSCAICASVSFSHGAEVVVVEELLPPEAALAARPDALDRLRRERADVRRDDDERRAEWRRRHGSNDRRQRRRLRREPRAHRWKVYMRANGRGRGLDRDHVLGRHLGRVARIRSAVGVRLGGHAELDPRERGGRSVVFEGDVFFVALLRHRHGDLGHRGDRGQDRRGRRLGRRIEGRRRSRTRRRHRRWKCARRPRRPRRRRSIWPTPRRPPSGAGRCRARAGAQAASPT